MDFDVLTDNRVKINKNEKKDKYLDFTRDWKKVRNMKMTVESIVVGALGMISKGLVRELEELEIGERTETIQTSALLKSAIILRRVLETWDQLSFRLQRNTISSHWCEKLARSNIVIMDCILFFSFAYSLGLRDPNKLLPSIPIVVTKTKNIKICE